jgi:aldose 1-epimerase
MSTAQMPGPVSHDAAMAPLAPGTLITLGAGSVSVDVAPEAGGRIAQIRHRGVDQLIGHDEAQAMIAWGSYPMAPWAGRIRHGRFEAGGRTVHLPLNLGGHAIHGVAFAMSWRIDAQSPRHVEMSLPLPEDERWPFGGVARQRIEVVPDRIRMSLSVTAGDQPMPATLGWHPWLRKPDRLDFIPSAFYPRDAEGIATLPLAPPPPGRWDDCFVNRLPVVVHRGDQLLRLSSNCTHWVVFDEPTHATCIEPQSGPPDAFNLAPSLLAPGEMSRAWFLWEWL